ncbi:D-amino acid dehydrogenase small subunit [invertebrate metagenome]|uniref:D-amino acid dehydrogenase small subunit n=1 Tax=invertebrate metagenome TaxID=1711999 RepID=A0A484H6B9_9ZZZZ
MVVLGAGVIGVATAYRLAQEGHEVIVIDRRPYAGLETSFANGGQVSASHAEPWATPTALLKVLRWLGREDAPLVYQWTRWDPALWSWLWRFLCNCTSARAHHNIGRSLRLALYSRAMLKVLRAETGITYDNCKSGILHIYRMARAFSHACAAATIMRAHGLECRPCSMATCLTIEPALVNIAPHLAGGLYSPDDESGDAYLFTTRLAGLAQAAGVDFRFGVTVRGLEAEAGRIVHVVTDHGPITGVLYVLSLGSYSPLIANTIGLNLPIYPAKGYSLTVDATGFSGAPTVSITDDEYKMVYTRLRNRLRIAGTAELVGWDATLTPLRAEFLLKRARILFPNGGDYASAVSWAGLRPQTPDSVPIIGCTPWPELLLNTGHGTLGWTMAVGSACIIADLVAGRPPAIDLEGLGLERF